MQAEAAEEFALGIGSTAGQGVLCQRPDPLVGIEFGGVAGEAVEMQPEIARLERTDGVAPVDRIEMNRSDIIAFIALLLAATAVAGVFLALTVEQSEVRLGEQPLIAAHLARGHGFASPVDASADAQPTNWAPPLYPYLMASVYHVVGIASPTSLCVMLLVNVLAYGLVVSGAWVIGRLLAGPLVAWLAAVSLLAHPLFLMRTSYLWDTYVALALFVWLLVQALALRGRPGWAGVARLGAGLALLVLTNVSYALTAPPIVLLATSGDAWRRRASKVLLSALVFGAVLLPWTLRNHAVFGEWMAVRGGPYLEMWLGNQPGSDGWMDLRRHPSVDPQERALFVEIGEQAYWALCRERFWKDYAADPEAFWWRSARRLRYGLVGPYEAFGLGLLGQPGVVSAARVASDAVLALLALTGMGLRLRQHRIVGWLAAAGLAGALPFVVTHISYRYLLPLKFVEVELAAIAVTAGTTALMQRMRMVASSAPSCV